MAKSKKPSLDHMHVDASWFESEHSNKTNFVIIVLIVIIVLFAAVALFIISNLQGRTNDAESIANYLTMKNTQLQHNINNLSTNRNNLQSLIENKEQQVDILNQKITGVEDVIKAVTNKKTPLEKPSQKINRLTLYNAVKKTMLRIIPNGEPIKDDYEISSPFGSRIHPVSGIIKMHTGIDLATSEGTPVYATADGVVEHADIATGYGNLVRLRHAFGFTTYYAHLSKYEVEEGQFIRKGDLIARVGSTGVSTGPHLHYEVRFLDTPLQPSNFIFWSADEFNDLFKKEDHVDWRMIAQLVIAQVSISIQETLDTQALKNKKNHKKETPVQKGQEPNPQKLENLTPAASNQTVSSSNPAPSVAISNATSAATKPKQEKPKIPEQTVQSLSHD